MVTSSSNEVGSPTKQEVSTTDGKLTKASSSSTPWSRLKDPRIVRVSRAFGGKDRHSKVCTIRGLRDRRVRLSVPTAIQLYDLQDRLGLNQPSKVVDWLLDAAKEDIDELPPLPISPGNFSLNHQAMLNSSLGINISQSSRDGLKMKSHVWDDLAGSSPQPNFWSPDALLRAKSREFIRNLGDEKQNWTRGDGDDKEETNEGNEAQVSSISTVLNRGNHSSSQGLVNNSSVPYGSFFHLENPSFQLSHTGSSSGFSSQTGDLYNLNAMPLPYTLSLSPGSSVLVRTPAAGGTQSYFPPHSAASMEIDPRQISQFQMLPVTSTQNLLSNSLAPCPFFARPFSPSMTPRPLYYPDHGGSQPYKEREFPLK